MINTAKEAEVSISPTIIIPVVANNGRYFRVRTLLDSGSGTNWISRKVLKRVKHTVKAKRNLQVSTFSGEVKQEFTLVEISTHDDQGKTRYIMCYVQDKYTAHTTAEGIVPHIRFNHTTPYSLSKPLADPNSLEVDHTDAADQVGMILCSATTNTLRTHEPVTLLPELKILLEPTIFGTAISGAIPKCLKSSHQRASAHNVAIKSACDSHNTQVLFQDEVTQQAIVRQPFNDKNYRITDSISVKATTAHTNFTCKQKKWDMSPKKQFPTDNKHRFCKYSASTSSTSFRQLLYCYMILLLCLAAAPLFYIFLQDFNGHHLMMHSTNIHADPAYSIIDHYNTITFLEISPTAQNPLTKLHRPYERGKSKSLAQSRMSTVVSKLFERTMFYFHFQYSVSKVVLRYFERKMFNCYFQSNVSRIVLGHFRRQIIHFHFPTCIQVKNKFLRILSEFHVKYPLNGPTNHFTIVFI